MEEEKKVVCPSCKKESNADFVFCPYCGKRTDGKTECPRCHYMAEADFTFCPKCGAGLHEKLGAESRGAAVALTQAVAAKAPKSGTAPAGSALEAYYAQKNAERQREGGTAGSAKTRFFAFEQKHRFIKNGVSLLLSLLLLIALLVAPVLKVGMGQLMVGNAQMQKIFDGLELDYNVFDLGAGLISESESVQALQDQLADKLDALSADTQEALIDKGYKSLTLQQQREVKAALSDLNFVKVMRSQEGLDSTKLSVSLYWTVFLVLIAAILANIAFMILLIVSLALRRECKLNFVGILIATAAGMLVSLILSMVSRTTGVSTGAATVITLGLIAAGLLFAYNVVFSEGPRVGHLKAIKTGAMFVFAAIFALICFVPALTLVSSIGNASYKTSVYLGDLFSVADAHFGGKATLTDLPAIFAQLSGLRPSELPSVLNALKTSLLYNSDIGKVYPFMFALSGIYPVVVLLASLAAVAIMVLMLMQLFTGKYFKNKLFGLLFLIPLALSVAAVIINGATIFMYNDSFAFQKVTMDLKIGAGPIFTIIFALGGLLFSLLFRHPKKSLDGGQGVSAPLEAAAAADNNTAYAPAAAEGQPAAQPKLSEQTGDAEQVQA